MDKSLIGGSWMQELQAFYKRQTVRPLSCEAQALWSYLFYRASEVEWQFPLKLSDPQLEGVLHIGPSRLQNGRKELVDSGFLLHDDLNGNKPDGYTLVFEGVSA